MMTRDLIGWCRHRWSSDAGVSLVEVLVAMSLLTIVLAGVASSLTQALRVSVSNQGRVVASNIAQYELERLRAIPFQSWVDNPAGLTSTTTRELDGATYTLIREAQWVEAGAEAGGCTMATGDAPAYVLVTQTIEFPQLLNTSPVVNQTVIRPPVGSYDPFTGHIAVIVRDRSGNPSSGKLVSASGPSSRTEMTDSQGCAFFPFLPPGDYVVGLNTAGYIDLVTETQDPDIDVTVVAAAVQTVYFSYDREARVSLVPQGQFGGSTPADLVFTIRNTAFTPDERVTPDQLVGTATAMPHLISNLFPFADGLSVYAGRCTTADPGAFPAGAASVAMTEPGQLISADVALGTLAVNTSSRLPQEYSVDLVQEVHPEKCPEGDRYQLGTTSAGGLVSAVPYGEWTVNIRTTAGIVASQSVVVDPTSPGATAVTF